MDCPRKVKALLKRERQEQLLEWYGRLGEEEQKRLLADIARVDFGVVRQAGEAAPARDEKITPYPSLTLAEIETRRDEYEKLGLEALAKGKLAAVVLAGGMGSRLGFEHAKGMYNLAQSGELSIFEILIRNMEDNARKAGRPIPFYVMTSDRNHEEIVRFFEEHEYFGYPADCVRFFRQEMAPSLGEDKRTVLLEAKDRVSFTPNGTGGWYGSLRKAGLLRDMKKRGVEWINVFSVDNVLQQIGDPVFLGAVLAAGTHCGAKVIAKADPGEKVGVICRRGGRPSVVEYSELSEEMRYEKNEAGEYVYHYGVTLNYLFDLRATARRARKSIPVHPAHKKIPYCGPEGGTLVSEKENGYKLETFIFDILEFFPDVTACEVVREKEFAPIKNAEGTDSPESARALLLGVRPEWKKYFV